MDFVLSDGKRISFEDCGDVLSAQLWNEKGEFIKEVNWDIDSIADMLFCEQEMKIQFHSIFRFVEVDNECRNEYGKSTRNSK